MTQKEIPVLVMPYTWWDSQKEEELGNSGIKVYVHTVAGIFLTVTAKVHQRREIILKSGNIDDMMFITEVQFTPI